MRSVARPDWAATDPLRTVAFASMRLKGTPANENKN
jgi:hypothetical protein